MIGRTLGGRATLAPPDRSSEPVAAKITPVAAENLLPGSPPEEWDIAEANDGTFRMGERALQGFTAEFSVNLGETVVFKIKTLIPPTPYHIAIYRLGYYGGAGARRVDTLRPDPTAFSQPQPACLLDPVTGLLDCGNWAVSAIWLVPSSAVSGIYLAKLVREDVPASRGSHIVFVVRDDARASDILFQTSDMTWHAYNSYVDEANQPFRNSLYGDGSGGKFPDGRASKVSYNRPFDTRSRRREFGSITFLFDGEYPMLRWLEANGYDVTYCSGVDTDRRGDLLRQHRLFLSVGHDEYWSAQQRSNVEAARAAGLHLGFFSGNEVFWKTRWESSIDGSATPHRTLVCYKETYTGEKSDPTSTWTGTWRDPRQSPPADGGRPENALTGTLFMVNAYRLDTISVPAALGRLRFWRHTDLAALPPNGTATLAPNVLGFEWDEDVDNGARPPGLMRLSSTAVQVATRLMDEGVTYGSGTAVHSLTLYRHASGALVFGAGTTRWAWGLDDHHDGEASVPDPRMQQAMVNLLADMGVQPATLQSSLIRATATDDTAAPTSAINFPQESASVPRDHDLTVTGTAVDAAGAVAAVEVSVDGGTTWHPALGQEQWSFVWRPRVKGPAIIRSRAVDDSGNLEAAGRGIAVTVGGAGATNSLWDNGVTPSFAAWSDPGPLEVGVRLRTAADILVTAIRFYKGPGNLGPHVGTLWQTDGAPLAVATFAEGSESGWQTAVLPSALPISAGTGFIASYHAPTGHYAANPGYFAASAVEAGPLSALRDGEAGGNGVFSYGPSPRFPTNSFNATNYWVDVQFSDPAV